MFRNAFIRAGVGIVLFLTAVAPSSSLQAQGIALTGIGPVNRSMGGAGTAAPLDAMGALHWNPGSISALPCNELGFGMELLSANVNLSSTVGGATATTSGEAGWSTIPAIGWVHHMQGTPVTIGLGLVGIGGFKNNMPLDPANPLLGALPAAYASSEILQIAPTLSYQLTEQLSVGFAPTITTVNLTLDPLGPPITPGLTTAQGNPMAWGAGFQAGAYFKGDNGIDAGFTFKSTQWVEELSFFTPGGGVANFNLDYPMLLSAGLAYRGVENWIFAIDGRYFDYSNTAGFKELGWRSVFAGAIGAQYRMTDRLTTRLGYNFNQNPIQPAAVALNLLDPLIQDQNIAAGASYRFTNNVDFNLAYVYLVSNSVTGPLPAPFPAGSTATHQLNAHSAIAGVSVRY